ncbi:ABC transporter ATP-binding protein [Treponema pedis]|uniref:ABC transporter ATP-binding protein n=2 Tax=Treponema pedis TaxID=409322 RepID=UPI0006865699|nr:ABC transporter ATP-binding protein [Treponema pedis]QSI05205.1 ABC transporter ATP-binding protein [Treponema pedis]
MNKKAKIFIENNAKIKYKEIYMIQLEHISKSYKKIPALSDLSYTFEQNNAYGILGINGAGKSTLIGCLTGNLSHSGTIRYEGINLNQIGYVPQELAIYPELSVLDNLLFFASVFKVPKEQAKSRATGLIERTGLQDKTYEKVKNLSGGMKRKLNLITGLIHNPKLLICDEVCVGIDPISRQEILEYLKELQLNGMSIIYTSHYLDEIEFLCGKILFLHQGKLILEGITSELVKTISGKDKPDLSDLFIQVIRKDGAL